VDATNQSVTAATSAPSKGPQSVISDLGKTTIFIGAYLYFLGSVYAGFFYRRLGMSPHPLDLSLNAILFDAYYPLKYVIGFHTNTCWTFVATALVLLLLLSRSTGFHGWHYSAGLLSVLLLILLFVAASYRIAFQAGFANADIFIKDPGQSVCLSFKNDVATKMPTGFLDGTNRNQRCGLHSIVETPDLLFLFDQATKKGPPSHVFVLRRDDVALVDISPTTLTSEAAE